MGVLIPIYSTSALAGDAWAAAEVSSKFNYIILYLHVARGDAWYYNILFYFGTIIEFHIQLIIGL